MILAVVPLSTKMSFKSESSLEPMIARRELVLGHIRVNFALLYLAALLLRSDLGRSVRSGRQGIVKLVDLSSECCEDMLLFFSGGTPSFQLNTCLELCCSQQHP